MADEFNERTPIQELVDALREVLKKREGILSVYRQAAELDKDYVALAERERVIRYYIRIKTHS